MIGSLSKLKLIEAFEENLWSAIKDKLAVLEFKRENFMDWVLETHSQCNDSCELGLYARGRKIKNYVAQYFE